MTENAAAMYPSATPEQPEATPERSGIASGWTRAPKPQEKATLADRVYRAAPEQHEDVYKNAKPSWALNRDEIEAKREGGQQGQDRQSTEDARSEGSEGVPDAYHDFAIPEGVEVDAEVLGEFQEVARDIGLSQDQAQQLVTMQGEFMQKVADQQEAALEDTSANWLSEAQVSPTFNSDVSAATVLLKTFDQDRAVRDLLENTRLGNHPSVIRLFGALGRRLGYS